ncbi:MAG: site-specific DNA-methyltransferase [Phycisphaerales bacterium]|nr:site-specific DNA-methyltransferase [Phycisphaerales bacterium]
MNSPVANVKPARTVQGDGSIAVGSASGEAARGRSPRASREPMVAEVKAGKGRKSGSGGATGGADFDFEQGRARVFVGDCRAALKRVPEVQAGTVDLVFADPPFNWNRAYDRWNSTAEKQHDAAVVKKAAKNYDTWDDGLPREDYLDFTYAWLKACADGLRPGGQFWVNIPDDTAAEIVVYCKNELKLPMLNWCVWHYRFGQNRTGGFINSKVHALRFVKPGGQITWNARPILEPSDRATTYFDPRTMSKRDGMPAGFRVPMDVWYGPYFGRVQGNNKERRPGHDNQLPEAYLERVILSCSNEGDVVLDPFVGSGTTGTVALQYKRRFVGCEYSLANARSAWERMTNLGMVSPGKALGQSSAIAKARSASEKAKKRTRVNKPTDDAIA